VLRRQLLVLDLELLLPLHVDLRLFHLVLLLQLVERHLDSLVLNSRVDFLLAQFELQPVVH
jgi:hypothetical protein